MSSGVIQCHLVSPGVTRCHPMSSGVIRRHQVSSNVNRCHPVSFGVIRCQPVSSGVIYVIRCDLVHRHVGRRNCSHVGRNRMKCKHATITIEDNIGLYGNNCTTASFSARRPSVRSGPARPGPVRSGPVRGQCRPGLPPCTRCVFVASPAITW